jgi:hypothetical protein
LIPEAFVPEKLTVIMVPAELGSTAATMIPQMSRVYPRRNMDLVMRVSQSQGAPIVKMRIRSGLGKSHKAIVSGKYFHEKNLGGRFFGFPKRFGTHKIGSQPLLGMTIEPWC